MSDYSGALRTELDRLLAERPRTEPHAIVDAMHARHPDAVKAEAARLVDLAMLRDIRALAKAEADENGGQMELFGFPRVLTVPAEDGGYSLVRADKASWADVSAQRGLMVRNVANAQARLDAYDAAMERVRPMMESTDTTLGDALDALTAQDVGEA